MIKPQISFKETFEYPYRVFNQPKPSWYIVVFNNISK